MTEQEIAEALLRHEPKRVWPDAPRWRWTFEAVADADERLAPWVLPWELSQHLRPPIDRMHYPTREAAYADLANAYRLVYPL